MPPLAQALKLNASFAHRHPNLAPTALFVGGTSGIGQALAQRLAHYTHGKARILLVGRNADAGRATIRSLRGSEPPHSQPKHEFIPCDATLMRNVRQTTDALLARKTTDIPKLNFLVLSPGFFSIFASRAETPEGIDTKLALLYYARWLFTLELLPLLRNAAAAGEPAHVYSVLGAGTGSTVDFDDLGLKTGYNALKAATVAASYTDLAMQKFAQENPDVQFSHAFPGLVRTPMMLPKHPLLKPFGPLMSLLSLPVTVPPETCAEYHLSALLAEPDATTGNFTRRGSKGDDIGYVPAPGGDVEKLWKHTVAEVLHV
ncbi:hypothetical protein HMN09_01234800 [Mycena chlorophos]|uniref:NAD(P)-binding protein n=1 Tax=Mycena chlorophos TaxID=658473 RepID=A0A8H6VRW6_MYCCL|nr:hypothetical protein HMN09_01234800 [Mycena chlorophos]